MDSYPSRRRRQNLAGSTDEYHHHDLKPCNRARSTSTQDISLSTFCLIVPILLLTAALLTFIQYYKLDNSTILPTPPNKIEGNVLYVNADSTLLVFISSWMSSLLPCMTAFAVALATYPIAQQLLQDSNDEKHDRLLTSFQLSIAIKFVNGSTWSSLWNLFRYNTGWDKPAARHGAALISITIITLTMVLLGVSLLATDTWLHIATKSVNVIQIASLPSHDALYSLNILPQCASTNNSFVALQAANLSCTVTTALIWPAIYDSMATLQTLNNQSNTLTVLRHPQIYNMHYLSPPSTAINASHDYTATSFAISTSCKPISRECNLVLTNDTSFNCSNGAFYDSGDTLSLAAVVRQSYRYSNMSDSNWDDANYGVLNPFFTAGAATNQLSFVIPENRTHDPDLAIADETVISAVFFCNTTVFDAEYSVAEGRVSNFIVKPSNVSTTNMFASAIAGTNFGSSNMQIAMKIAAPGVSSAQDYADAFADSLTAIGLASGAASVRAAPVVTGQRRDTLLVSQVPKAPLFLLISLNLSFVILGLVLATLATMTNNEARAVQFRLSIAGIVANLFEGPHARAQAETVEQLFGEYHGSKDDMRIKIQRTSTGGFVFKSVEDVSDVRASGNEESLACENAAGWSRKGGKFRMLLSVPSPSPLRSGGLLVEDRWVDPASGQAWI